MRFIEHYALKGKHAMFSCSQNSWVNYDDDALRAAIESKEACKRGTRLHALAADLIDNRIKLPNNTKTLNRYVNDAIGFKMNTEQILCYSRFFGTADAIRFKNDMLRIHDLKTGVTKTTFVQLRLYAALFCLEYGVDPQEIKIELRIYQNNEIKIEEPTSDMILELMDKIMHFDDIMSEYQTDNIE